MELAPIKSVVGGSIAFVMFWVTATFPKFAGLPIGRTAGAIVSAVLMVVFQVDSPDEAYAAINLPILGLLFGTMVVSIYLQRADMSMYLNSILSYRCQGGKDLLCRLSFLVALSGALFTNDTCCVVFTGFILTLCKEKGLPPEPFLLALATSANLGSSATPIGNPQNLVIAIQSKISFGKFIIGILPAMLVGVTLNLCLLLGMYWKQLSIGSLSQQTELKSEDLSEGKSAHTQSQQWDKEGMEMRIMIFNDDDTFQSCQSSGSPNDKNDPQNALNDSKSIHLNVDRPVNADAGCDVMAQMNDQSSTHHDNKKGDPQNAQKDGKSIHLNVDKHVNANAGCDFIAQMNNQSSTQHDNKNSLEECTNSLQAICLSTELKTGEIRSTGSPTSHVLGDPLPSFPASDKYAIVNTYRRCIWKTCVYLVTLGMLAALLAGLDLSWCTITAAIALIVIDFKDAGPSLSKVPYTLLVFFSGMFITVDGFNRTGLPAAFWNAVEPHARINHASGTAVLTCVIILLSNIASNVPTVLLLGPKVAASSAALPGASVTKAWMILAWASTVAGNLTLVGSAANLIVCEQARTAPGGLHNLSFWRHLKFGLPSTLLTVAVGLPLIRG